MIDYARGIDVNHYHRPKDWGAVFGSGVSFVGLKATQGTDYVDPTFVDSRAAATPAAVVLLYHFADGAPWSDQTDHFLDVVGDLAANEHLVLDLERGRDPRELPFVGDDHSGPVSEVFNGAEDFIETVTDTVGRRPLIYTRRLWLDLGNPHLEWTDSVGLWLPRYCALELGPGELPGAWHGWTFWQWSDGTTPPHTVPGVGAVDSNVFNGTVEDLKAWATL